MSSEFQPQLEQEQKPLSLADRLKEAKNKAAEKLKTLEKTSVSRARSARGHVENFKNLSVDITEYNVLKDIAFETYFKTLARDLKKNELPIDFNAKWKDIKAAKIDLAKFDEMPPEIKRDEDLCKVFEDVRSEITVTMREWAKILSEWFAEHADIHERESEEVSGDIQKVLSHPLFTADYRSEHETFDDAARRTTQEFSDREAGKIQNQLLRSFVYHERNREDSDLDSKTIDLLSFIQTEPVSPFAQIRKIASNKKRDDLEKNFAEFESEIKKIYPNLEYYLRGREHEIVKILQKLLLDFDKLLTKADAIERAAEAQRSYSERQLAQVFDVIDKEFSTDVERQDALTFVKLADDQAHNKPSNSTFSSFRGSFRVGDYGGNPPPDWLIAVYKKLNNVHLFSALLRGDLEAVESRVNEDQLLRVISNEPSHGNSEPDESIIANAEITESGGYSKIVTTSLDTKLIRSTYPLDNPGSAENYYKATLDPEIVAQVESFWRHLAQQGALPKDTVTRIGVLRSFFAGCSIQGVSYETQQINPQSRFDGYEKGLHIMSTELKNRTSYFVNEVDLRLAQVKPTSLQRLSEMAKKDGVIELTSVEDSIEVISALKLMISQYLNEDKPKLIQEAHDARSAARTAEESAEAIKRAAAVERGNLQQRINEAIQPHQNLVAQHEYKTRSLEEQLQNAHREYSAKIAQLEAGNHDLISRDLTRSHEITELRSQLKEAKSRIDRGNTDVIEKVQAAINAADAVKGGGIFGGKAEAQLKVLIEALKKIGN